MAAQRVNAPPGLTGFWQVNGKNKTTFTEMIAMDIHYSVTMSPGQDLNILFKTLPAVLGQVYESKIAAPSRRASNPGSAGDGSRQVVKLF
jgi:lipopolysaccharide/colanic/teichoic acid biosynthesis glycosyltransferase